MSIIPSLPPRQLLLLLLRAGFKILRQKGSHIRIEHPVTKKSTTIVMHPGELSGKIISKILKQAGLAVSEFLKLLGK